jgi:hypothetical protein
MAGGCVMAIPFPHQIFESNASFASFTEMRIHRRGAENAGGKSRKTRFSSLCVLCALYVQNTFTAFYYPSSSGSRGDEHSEASREHDDVRATPDRASTCHGRRGAGDNPDASCSIVRTAD